MATPPHSDQIIASAIDSIIRFRSAAGAYVGPALPWLEFFGFVISALFIWGIVYTVTKSNWLVYKVDEWVDVLNAGDLSRRRIVRGWKQILKRLQSPAVNDWKLAVLEADKILGDLLRLAGFEGQSIHERLEKVPPTVLSNIVDIKTAHGMRDKIRREPDFALSHDETQALIGIYAKAFKELDLID